MPDPTPDKTLFNQTLKFSFSGPGKIFLGPATAGLSMPAFTLTGRNPKNLLSPDTPRPDSDDWLYVPVEQVKEQPDVKISEVRIGGILGDFEADTENESYLVSADAIHNDDPDIYEKFWPTTSSPSFGQIAGGGSSVLTKRSLIVLRENKNRAPVMFYQANLYFRGVITPQFADSGYDADPLKFEFRSLPGLDGDGCIRTSGSHFLFQFFYVNGAGAVVKVDRRTGLPEPP